MLENEQNPPDAVLLPCADDGRDAGIWCLTSLLRFHGISADPATLGHQLGGGDVKASEYDLIRLARRHGLKARVVKNRRWSNLSNTPLPAIARKPAGDEFFILAKIVDERVLIQDGRTMRPEAISREAFEASWDGSLLLLTRRAELSDFSQKFGIGWFVAAMHKYRRLLAKVLVASFQARHER